MGVTPAPIAYPIELPCILAAVVGSDLTDRNRTSLTDAFLASRAALTRYVATFFVQREEIEDTLQQAYTDALTAETEKGTQIESPRAYLFRVARNIALNKKKLADCGFETTQGRAKVSRLDDYRSRRDRGTRR